MRPAQELSGKPCVCDLAPWVVSGDYSVLAPRPEIQAQITEGHRSTFLNATGALISDNYLLEKRSRVLSAPSKKLEDRRKLLTMGHRRCISVLMLKTRYCLIDE